MRAVAALAVVAVSLPSCGASNNNSLITKVCRSTRGQVVASPVTGTITALGRPPVRLRIDNPGHLALGQAVLVQPSLYPGWFVLRTRFFTPPSFKGGFTVRALGIVSAGIAGIGPAPPGGRFTASPGPALETSGGWRQWPAYTWVRQPGCYAFEILGPNISERIVVAALSK